MIFQAGAHALEVAAFELHEVVDAQPGEHRGFFAAKPWHATVAAVRGQSPCLL
jgi:hypothetical protein